MAAAVVVSVLLRVPMLFTPINADEGGYLAIARAWAHGRVLYRDVWVDRPQGLLVLFRVWDWVSLGHTSSIRVMAMLFGAVLVVATAVITRELFGDVAARGAAVICAVLSAAPMLEGYIPNGELLSGAVSATAIAVAITGLCRPGSRRWLFVAGVLAGLALSLKQSAFDGVAVVLVWIVARAVLERTALRRQRGAIVAFAAGVLPVAGVLVADGYAMGFERWWWAIGGYRSNTLSLFHDPRWDMLRRTARYGVAVLGPAALLAVVAIVVGVLRRSRRRTRPASAPRGGAIVVCSWLLLSSVAFLLGGAYWRHYWLLLAAPISAIAGAALGALRRAAPVLIAVAVMPALVLSLWVFHGPRRDISERAAADRRSMIDERVARWFDTHRRPGEHLYVLCGGAAVYADIDEDPPVPYLWFPEVLVGPDATSRLLAYFSSNPPTYIAAYNTPAQCDPTGTIQTTIDRSYRTTTNVDGVTILERQPDSASDRVNLTGGGPRGAS